MSSKPSSKFLSRASVGEVMSSAYDMLTAAGQTINPIKSTPATQPYDNEAAVRDFQNAVRALLYMLRSFIWFCSFTARATSSRRASRRTMNLLPS